MENVEIKLDPIFTATRVSQCANVSCAFNKGGDCSFKEIAIGSNGACSYMMNVKPVPNSYPPAGTAAKPSTFGG